VLQSRDVQLLPAAQPEIHPSLGYLGGGKVQTDPRDPTKPAQKQFEVRIKLDNARSSDSQPIYYPGQKAYVRFWLDEKKPLIWQWGRRLMQLIETKQKESKWM
jgi:hypothetical protein